MKGHEFLGVADGQRLPRFEVEDPFVLGRHGIQTTRRMSFMREIQKQGSVRKMAIADNAGRHVVAKRPESEGTDLPRRVARNSGTNL